MRKYTQKQLKAIPSINLNDANGNTRTQMQREHGYYTQIGYSLGVYGCNGMLLQFQDGTLATITARTTSLYIF